MNWRRPPKPTKVLAWAPSQVRLSVTMALGSPARRGVQVSLLPSAIELTLEGQPDSNFGVPRRVHSAYALRLRLLHSLLACISVAAGFLLFDTAAGKHAPPSRSRAIVLKRCRECATHSGL